jgi:hypothetical protein
MDAEAPSQQTDPVGLIRSLDPSAIRQRIDDLDRERRALLTLLRAAIASQREGKEVPHLG